MQKNKLNNVIILKEISSNIVEEAIVFLKPNINIKESEFLNLKHSKKCEFNKEKTIIKEAENVIENHVKQIENTKKIKENKNIEKKYKYLKRLSIILFIINIFCIFKIF